MRYARVTRASGGEVSILPAAVVAIERTKDIGIVSLMNAQNQPLLVRGSYSDVVAEFDAALSGTASPQP